MVTNPRIATPARRTHISTRLWSPKGSPALGILLMLPLIFALIVFFALPLARMIWLSFTQPHPGWENYSAMLQSPAAVRALLRTVLDSVLVTILAVSIGTLLAWELATAESRVWKAAIWVAVLFTLWTNVVVRNYAFTLILERYGVINGSLLKLGVIHNPLSLLYTNFAVILGMLHMMIPYAIIPIYATLVNIPMHLSQAAQSLGASRARAFLTIVLPLASRSLIAAGSLVFVISIGFYITPILLGGAQTPFVASLISSEIFAAYNVPYAGAMGAVLFAIAAVVLAFAWRVAGSESLKKVLK